MVNDAKGGTVYRDHLPMLGEQNPGRSGPHGLAIGDQVSLRVYMCKRGDSLVGNLESLLYSRFFFTSCREVHIC